MLRPAFEFLPRSDTTGLLQESLGIDDLPGEVNAVLRSDPELRKAITE